MFEKEILRDTYNDQRINRIHMYTNTEGTGLFYDANCVHVVPYDEAVNAIVNGFVALKKDNTVYSPGKYTKTEFDVTIDFGDDIQVVIEAPKRNLYPTVALLATTFDSTDSQANQAAVKSVTYVDGVATIDVVVDDLVEYASDDPNQGTHKWIGLDVNTGLDTIVGLIYNGSYTMAQSDVEEAASVALGAGHLVLWVKADELVETPKTITIGKRGYNTVTIEIGVSEQPEENQEPDPVTPDPNNNQEPKE